MHNKKVLSKIDLGSYQKPNAYKNDIIYDPRGQWDHPGQNTRIPGGDITMKNVPYPVWAQPNVGPGTMMMPEQDYYFPGAEYVDEYPQMKKGGSKKGSKKYTRNIFATNKLFAESNLFKKPKKNQIFDPNASFYKDGGALLTKKVTCKKCGWTWNAADGGNDMTTCHKCGSQGLVHAKKGGAYYDDSRDAWVSADGKVGPNGPAYYQDGGEYFEMELTPEEINEYKKGGFIVEDISIPSLNQMAKGGPGDEGDEDVEGESQENFLRNWFINRQMPTPEGQKLLEKVRPEAIERASQKVPYIMTNTLPDNVAGYYDTEDENIYLNQSYPSDQLKSTKYHEKLHYVQGGDKFYKVLDKPHQYLVEQNIKSPEEINTGNSEWDANIKANYDDIIPPEEMHARIMTLRRLAGFKPDQVITEKDVEDYFKKAGENLDPDIQDIKQVTKGTKSIVELLNHMAANKGPSRDDMMDYAKKGGIVTSLTQKQINQYIKDGYMVEELD